MQVSYLRERGFAAPRTPKAKSAGTGLNTLPAAPPTAATPVPIAGNKEVPTITPVKLWSNPPVLFFIFNDSGVPRILSYCLVSFLSYLARSCLFRVVRHNLQVSCFPSSFLGCCESYASRLCLAVHLAIPVLVLGWYWHPCVLLLRGC